MTGHFATCGVTRKKWCSKNQFENPLLACGMQRTGGRSAGASVTTVVTVDTDTLTRLRRFRWRLLYDGSPVSAVKRGWLWQWPFWCAAAGTACSWTATMAYLSADDIRSLADPTERKIPSQRRHRVHSPPPSSPLAAVYKLLLSKQSCHSDTAHHHHDPTMPDLRWSVQQLARSDARER
jgi:hypothetical protein